jgi:hypothetical protein
MQQMPQMGQMPPGVPTQGGISALAAQGAQLDPRLAAIMQAMQKQGGMPGAGMMPPGGMPTQQTQQAMLDQIRQTSPAIGLPGMPMRPMPGIAAPGGVPVQRPLPVGTGGKGTGMPGSGVPGAMVNPPRPMMPTPRPTPRPVTPRPAGFTGFR